MKINVRLTVGADGYFQELSRLEQIVYMNDAGSTWGSLARAQGHHVGLSGQERGGWERHGHSLGET